MLVYRMGSAGIMDRGCNKDTIIYCLIQAYSGRLKDINTFIVHYVPVSRPKWMGGLWGVVPLFYQAEWWF